MSQFWTFIDGEDGLLEVSDDVLVRFRDAEFEKTFNSAAGRRNPLTAKRTTNAKLRRVYHFIQWCQEVGYLGEAAVSVFPRLGASSGALHRGGGKRRHEAFTYPVLFRRAGESSRIRHNYFATASDISHLKRYFRDHNSEYVCARNCLIVDIADSTGLRRESIASLTCQQFISREEELVNGRTEIVPAKQKLDYTNSFEFPRSLVLSILNYIYTIRTPFLQGMGWVLRAGDALFVSGRSGRPVTKEALSTAFHLAFKEIGAAKGAGLHSFRRRFAERCVREELTVRLKLGLDTSAASISASVAIQMGHANPKSLESYISRSVGSLLTESE
ncbi:hypothetical protein [Niveibacterium sp. SC-1]|uniref:hypothetical protein n=1 Tax=Niveibacterium sp. SC-1 TaxID=3135646 RepID=UPI00311F9696